MAWEALAAEFETATGRKPYPFELDIILRFWMVGTWAASVKSEWIRGYLLTLGEGYPYGMWKEYRRFAEFLDVRPGTYIDFVKYIYYLKRLGLIVLVRREQSSRRGIQRTYYRVAPGMENHPAWRRPLQTLFPSSDWSRSETKAEYRRRYR